MRITIQGAGGGEVTGSPYLVRTAKANVLVDFGLFQGAKKLENSNRLPTRVEYPSFGDVVMA
jgi:metallo-beta-lactamase family protein